MIETNPLPEGMQITAENIAKAPRDVLEKLLMYLLKENRQLKKRIEELETKLNQDSSNSNRPPSSDSPFQKQSAGTKKKSKSGSKKGHKGHRQQMLDPTEIQDIHLSPARAGATALSA